MNEIEHVSISIQEHFLAWQTRGQPHEICPQSIGRDRRMLPQSPTLGTTPFALLRRAGLYLAAYGAR